MSSDLVQFLGVILAAFIGATLSHYFTLWKYQKDILYQKKVDTYVELSKSIISFETFCISINPPATIVMAYQEMLDNINRAYLFMPEEMVTYIQNVIGNPFLEFKKLTKLDEETCNYIFSFRLSSKDEPSKANPKISEALVKVFNPFLLKIPHIGIMLKEDLGTVKVGIHFLRK